MSASPDTSFDFSPSPREKRLTALNQDRLRRVHASLTPRQQDFLDVLPLLFHINHPLLPGYVNQSTPFGIADYSPSEASLKAAHRISRAFEYTRRMAPRIALRGLYMMGSPGTIAYSRSSDLDLWLIHDPHLTDEQVEAIKQKATLVEQFAEGIGLEVHFFVFDAERFRRGETLSLSDESSGSSQHFLLLDEFYRSGLVIAGLTPLWWRVPARHEKDYQSYIEAAVKRQHIRLDEHIDFGGVGTVPTEEFFGAALWHLYKSILSPYKSVLKLVLMEAYAAAYPDVQLLSIGFKQNIESDDIDLEQLDPYILMLNKIENYLKEEDDAERLAMVRRSFYIKVNIHINVEHFARAHDWRSELMAALIERWGWHKAELHHLNTRANWKLNSAVDERHAILHTLNRSYAALSRFARKHADEIKITENDLHALGRKLYAAFEKKPGKIELVTRGICANPTEPSLSVHEVTDAKGHTSWMLFNDTVGPSEVPYRHPIKQSNSAAELVVWAELNRLCDDSTTWHIFAQQSNLSPADIRHLRHAVVAVGPGVKQAEQDSNHAAIKHIALLTNFGVSAFANVLRDGKVLTSDHNDPLAYGARNINLVRTVDMLIKTSWGETFVFHYSADTAILEAIADCLQWRGKLSQVKQGSLSSWCFGLEHGRAISERVGKVFQQALKTSENSNEATIRHFVVQTGTRLAQLSLNAGKPQVAIHEQAGSLIRSFATLTPQQQQYINFDQHCSRAGLLPAVLKHAQPGQLQIYACVRNKRADVYIVDERGAVLVQRPECHSVDCLLRQYRRFVDNALPRCLSAEDHTTVTSGDNIATYAINLGERGQVQFERHTADHAVDDEYLRLSVFADVDANGQQHFTIYVAEREFSTWNHGASLFEQVAEFVLAQRAEDKAYPIYITDLDLSLRYRRATHTQHLMPFDLLRIKKVIELKLTHALRSLENPTTPSLLLAS